MTPHQHSINHTNPIISPGLTGLSQPNGSSSNAQPHKYLTYGSLSRYKARHKANDNTQLSGINVDETFSLIVKQATISIVLSLAVYRDWHVHELDVKNAILHGDLSKTVYMHQPPGFWDRKRPTHGTGTAYLLLYVDEIILTASSTTLLQQTVLEMALMVRCNMCPTHADTESKLRVEGDHVYGPTLYRSLTGALQYLTFTRADISFVVQHVYFGLQLYSSSTASLVANSDADSVEVEYHGVTNDVAETCWMWNLLRELHSPYLLLLWYIVITLMQFTYHLIRFNIKFVDIFTKDRPIALFDEFHSS
ncbi:ribonuclease H-like domain-containing protein [Tanacetum coccineum]